jgi:hypothetical protein
MSDILPNMENKEVQAEEPISPEKKAELLEEKKQNRKIDISLILSIAALVISLFQLIVSSPFFIDYYYKASFEVIEEPPSVRSKIFTSAYLVKNTSRNTVNNIEISLQLLASDSVQIIPSRNVQLTFKENGPHLKNGFLSIDKLVPNESFLITIDSELDSVIYYNSSFLKNATLIKNELQDSSLLKISDWKLDYIAFPTLGEAKFDKGFAKIIRQPIKETMIKLEKLKHDSIRK